MNLWAVGVTTCGPCLGTASQGPAAIGLYPGDGAHCLLPYVSWRQVAGESVQQGRLEAHDQSHRGLERNC